MASLTQKWACIAQLVLHITIAGASRRIEVYDKSRRAVASSAILHKVLLAQTCLSHLRGIGVTVAQSFNVDESESVTVAHIAGFNKIVPAYTFAVHLRWVVATLALAIKCVVDKLFLRAFACASSICKYKISFTFTHSTVHLSLVYLTHTQWIYISICRWAWGRWQYIHTTCLCWYY